MKEMLHKTREAFHKRVKIVTIEENSEDKECVTNVRKDFVYVVCAAEEESTQNDQPQIQIRKSFDTKTRSEKFAFKIKGSFFVNKNRRIFRVLYCHALKIDLLWKVKVFSPKKSVTMA